MSRFGIKKVVYLAVAAVLAVFLAVLVSKRANAVLIEEEPDQPTVLSSTGIIAPAPDTPEEKVEYGVYISEVMPKNSAGYRNSSGEFSDYIELYNSSDIAVDLTGWSLSDKGKKSETWSFSGTSIAPGEYLLVFADGKGTDLHTSFSLSSDETVTLYDKEGNTVSALSCAVSQGDAVMVRDSDGNARESLYPTPGLPNTPDGYETYQQSLSVSGPLIINEAVVSNIFTYYKGQRYDWVEIKNISGSAVQLSEYCLSDDGKELQKWHFPEYVLEPKDTVLVFCGTEQFKTDGKYVFCPFSLDSLHEKLFLSHGQELIDYASLRDIPYSCSMGRLEGKNGFFFFDTPSPLEENYGGYRYVAAKPVSLTPDGVFSGTDNVTLELASDGDIYYTLDGTVPTESSARYSSPISIEETTIVRAISVEPGAMKSRPATFSYFIDEGCSMPIVSLVVDDANSFSDYWRKADKTKDVPANVAFYEDGGSFNMGCTVKFTGDASLTQNGKRGMRVKFRGAFGADTLHYDLFEGGITDFSSLSLRTGNDNILTYVRNELAQDLGLEFTDNVVSQHGRYCIVYLNGEYVGLYCLKEKICRQYVATIEGVSKNSVEITDMEEIMTYGVGNSFYNEVYAFITRNDMSVPANYEKLCEILDVDSLIDWFIMEGQCGNWDMIYRNISFYRSSETDGKWRLIYYDLDRAYKGGENAVCVFRNIFTYNRPTSRMIPINQALMKNPDYKERFTRRCAQALTTVYTDENIMKYLDLRQAEVAPEVEKDCIKWGRTYAEYEKVSAELREYIQKFDSTNVGYCDHSIDVICELLNISKEEFLACAK